MTRYRSAGPISRQQRFLMSRVGFYGLAVVFDFRCLKKMGRTPCLSGSRRSCPNKMDPPQCRAGCNRQLVYLSQTQSFVLRAAAHIQSNPIQFPSFFPLSPHSGYPAPPQKLLRLRVSTLDSVRPLVPPPKKNMSSQVRVQAKAEEEKKMQRMQCPS